MILPSAKCEEVFVWFSKKYRHILPMVVIALIKKKILIQFNMFSPQNIIRLSAVMRVCRERDSIPLMMLIEGVNRNGIPNPYGILRFFNPDGDSVMVNLKAVFHKACAVKVCDGWRPPNARTPLDTDGWTIRSADVGGVQTDDTRFVRRGSINPFAGELILDIKDNRSGKFYTIRVRPANKRPLFPSQWLHFCCTQC
jgi:hypothetical protein